MEKHAKYARSVRFLSNGAVIMASKPAEQPKENHLGDVLAVLVIAVFIIVFPISLILAMG